VINQSSCLRLGSLGGISKYICICIYVVNGNFFHMYLLCMPQTAALHHDDTPVALGHGLFLKLLLLLL
jgi:hypothetical protein